MKRLIMSFIRLDKFISSQLAVSRTDAKKLLRQKRVSVNGQLAVSAELQIDPACDTVFLDDTQITYRKYLYIMQNKPQGVVSASADGNTTVVDILPAELKRPGLFPAGRLDKDTTGFVLITDDGPFAHMLLSPAHHVEKTYIVTLEREVTAPEIAEITAGMLIGEERFRPAGLRYLDTAGGYPRYEIVLTEGRYHQIKRMFGAQKNAVCALKRIKIGALSLDPLLAPGESRALTDEEVQLLLIRQNI